MAPLLREFQFLSLNNWSCSRHILIVMKQPAGFARAIQGSSSGDGWDHLYDMSYLYGFFTTLTAHWALHTIFPAERQRGSSPFVLEEHAQMVHVGESDSGTVADEEKIVNVAKS